MQKRLIPREEPSPSSTYSWLPLELLADVEVSSEQSACPIESALLPDRGPGWRASEPGSQTVRLRFATPQRIARIRLVFVEEQTARVQEFVLRWLPAGGTTYREIVRQQYGFSPPGTVREQEDYTVDLADVAALELLINPDISGHPTPATLRELRVA